MPSEIRHEQTGREARLRVIRKAMREERAHVETIVGEAYARYTERIGKPAGPVFADYAQLIDEGRVWVLAEAGAVLGILVLVLGPEGALLDNVAVAPTAQGRGLGRALIGHAELTAKASGFEAITLYTNAVMTENIAKYARLGYVETHRASEDGYDRVYMRKPLS